MVLSLQRLYRQMVRGDEQEPLPAMQNTRTVDREAASALVESRACPGKYRKCSPKGLARTDLSGFTVRLCPDCDRELALEFASKDVEAVTVHRCKDCSYVLKEQARLSTGAQSLATAA